MKVPEAEVAASAGLSVSSYCDLEAYDDEWKDIPLGQLKAICRKLQLDLCPLIQPAPVRPPNYILQPRSAAIADALHASGKSVAAVADEIGVIESTVYQLLSDPATLETWPTEFVVALSDSLGVPWASLCES